MGAETSLTKRERGMLRRRLCAFCECRLAVPAAGRCGSYFRPEGISDDDCGWVKAFRVLGVEEAIRQSRMPHDQRSPL